MFSAYFLTCMMNVLGQQVCNVAYTEMPDYVQNQNECDLLTEQMHEFVLLQTTTEYPNMFVTRKEHGCYGGPLSAGEVARDEHAKLLNEGIDASLTEVP